MKKYRIIALGMACVVVVAGVAVYTGKNSKSTKNVTKEVSVEKGDLVAGITESGSVTLGTVEQNFDIDISDSSSSNTTSGDTVNGGMEAQMMGTSAGNTTSSSNSSSADAGLEVEEVYVTEGQVVDKGTALLKVTSASVKEMRAELENQLSSAELSLKNAKLEKKSTKVDADYTYKENVAKGKSAKTEYKATLVALQKTVDEAQDAINNADTRIAQIPKEITKLQNKKKTITVSKKTTTLYAIANEQAGENSLNVTEGQNTAGQTSTVESSASGGDTTTVSGINEQIETLKEELSSLKKNYSNLVFQLSKAKSAQVTGKIEAKKAYDEALLNYDNAKEIYDIAVDGLEDEIKEAKASRKEAKETLKEFEKFVKDGVITSEYAGTILSVGYETGDILTSDTAIATFADADEVTLDVSVSQEDVSKVEVGDAVQIVFHAYEEETYQGTVQEITTSETSSNSSTVDYDVTVKVEGDVAKIYEGMTANVTFITKKLENVLYVSNKAIVTEDTKSYVAKKDGDKVEKVEVTTGFSNGNEVEIQSGLSEGDVVLIESQVNAS